MRYGVLIGIAIVALCTCKKRQLPYDNVDRYGVVEAKAGLNVRETPGTDARILTTIPYGHFLEILERDAKSDMIDGHKGKWSRVKYLGISGYAFDIFYRGTMALAVVHPASSPMIGKLLHEGLDCGGAVYSEYGGTLDLSDGKVSFRRLGGTTMKCDLKDPKMVDPGLNAAFSTVQTGTYVMAGNRILLTLTRTETVISPSEVCQDTTPQRSSSPMNETHTAFPVLCTDGLDEVPGLIIPGLGEPGLIWVEHERHPAAPTASNVGAY